MSHSRMTRVIAFIAFLTAAHAVPTHAAPPANFTYQGQLKLEGVPVTGEIDFRFTLWDAPEEGREVAEGIELRRVKVVNGLFAVNLDFGPEVFNGEPRWLQIAARESEREEFIVLTPRQPITPTPVALFALTGNQGPPGPEGPAGEGMTLPYAGTAESSDVGAFIITQTGFAAAVGIAIVNPANTQQALGIGNMGSGPGVLSMTASGHAIWGQTGPGGGHAGFFKTMGTDNSQAALLAHNQAIGSAGHFKVTKRENTNPALLVETWSDGSAAHFKTYRDPNNVNLAPTILAESDQYASAGHSKIINDATTATALKAETLGGGLAFEAKTTSTGGAGKFEIANVANTNTALEAVTNGTGHAASFTATNTSSSEATLMVEARGNNAAVHAEALGDGTALFGRASRGADAVVGISNGFGQAGIFQVNDPDNNRAAVEITSAGTAATLRVVNTNPTSYRAGYFVGQVVIARTAGTLANSVQIQPTSGGAQLKIFNSTGISTIRLDAEYGGVGRITTDEIMINGGSDISEQFDVEGSDGVVPGTVVCIDKDNPGKLATCRHEYDKTVAGIISGAGGVRPGMLMAQKGSVADGAHPVALSGRVFCRVNTTNGPIEPGDLLTTSNTPGVAVKVTDHVRANGAIIGKAMTGLADGQGLVLVLVSLQ
ncbi:MAG: hypothetical protein IIC02_00835 [Planctomycetes bacterium]|nr:hypothetical protein [Planctomycetota bacterium]